MFFNSPLTPLKQDLNIASQRVGFYMNLDKTKVMFNDQIIPGPVYVGNGVPNCDGRQLDLVLSSWGGANVAVGVRAADEALVMVDKYHPPLAIGISLPGHAHETVDARLHLIQTNADVTVEQFRNKPCQAVHVKHGFVKTASTKEYNLIRDKLTIMETGSLSQGTLHSTISDSGKSGSSKSNKTNDSAKEIDFTKDNSTSPIDIECYIQCERIKKILDEAIRKTKMAISIPALVKDNTVLESILTDDHLEDLRYILAQYNNPMFSGSLLNIAALDDIRAGDVSLKNRLNPELGHLIYIMNSYPILEPEFDRIINEMIIEHSETGKKEPPLAYLMMLEFFTDLMVRQMNMSAAEVLSAKFQQKKMEAHNADLNKRIGDLKKSLFEEQKIFINSINEKKDIIAKLEQELSWLGMEAAAKLKKQILDSDRQMVLTSRKHAVKNELLKEEDLETRKNYNNLLRDNLNSEKNLRLRRFKVETQLLSWLQKYDQEMGDKQMELDEYIESFKEEETKCEKLEKDLEKQNKEYLPLMEEREKEYHAEMEKKMNEFMMEHAARVIQIAWKTVLHNRAAKKKLKKVQAKLKVAIERKENQEKKREVKEKKKAKEEARKNKKKK